MREQERCIVDTSCTIIDPVFETLTFVGVFKDSRLA